MIRASFFIVDYNDQFLILQDRDGLVSLTNDAENILKWAAEYYPGLRVIYYDTYGELTEMSINSRGRVEFSVDSELVNIAESVKNPLNTRSLEI